LIFSDIFATQIKKLQMYTKFSKIIALCFITVMATSLSAQKFGYVNTQEIIQGLPQVKEANSNIEAFQTQLQKKGQEMLQTFQTKYQDLERKQAEGLISPKELEVEAQKLKEEESKILEFEQTSQQKILEKSETVLGPIRQQIQDAINQVASENGYTYIFDFSSGFILYGDESANVGSLVKAKLGL